MQAHLESLDNLVDAGKFVLQGKNPSRPLKAAGPIPGIIVCYVFFITRVSWKPTNEDLSKVVKSSLSNPQENIQHYTLPGISDIPHFTLWFCLSAPLSLQDTVVMYGLAGRTTSLRGEPGREGRTQDLLLSTVLGIFFFGLLFCRIFWSDKDILKYKHNFFLFWI